MKRDTKQQLLDKGLEILIQKGYNHTGIQEILAAVGVPKGSFYHFFKSKEDFGLQVLEYYGQLQGEAFQNAFLDDTHTPLKRLEKFFMQGFKAMDEMGYCGGCLVGNLSQELADLSPVFAARLESRWHEMETWIARCLMEAKAMGEVPQDLSPHTTASFLVNAWQGVIMRSKLMKSKQPYEAFSRAIFGGLLPSP